MSWIQDPGVDWVGTQAPGRGRVWESRRVIVRPRTDDDMDACVRMATIIHDLDGYPSRHPIDFREFLVSADAFAAWVAERDGQVVGHVALHRHSTPEVLAMASRALIRPVDRLGVVARLLVSPDVRRKKIGRTCWMQRQVKPLVVDSGRFSTSSQLSEPR